MSASRFKQLVKKSLGQAARRFETPWNPDPALWGLSYSEAGLMHQGVALETLADSHGSPLHVVDFATLESNAQAVINARSASGTPCKFLCSYKTNPVPGILQRLHAQGAGADVVSAFELWLALRLQVPPEAIVYNGPVKSDDSLHAAIDAGIACINANSLGDLQRIGEQAAALGTIARVGLRVALQGGWSGQFGLQQNAGEMAQAVTYAREHPQLELVGLHVHRGIWIRSEQQLKDYVRAVMQARNELQRDHGVSITTLDLGGSLACPTVGSISAHQLRLNRSFLVALPRPEPAITPAEYARIALDTVDECLQGQPAPEVILEPGRGITGNAQMMLTTVADIKPDDEGFSYAILDAGIHNAESMRNENHAILPLQTRGQRSLHRYRLTGPLCTPADVLRYSVTLPELKIGDRLAIMDSGAYFMAFSSPFSYPRPAVIAIDNGEVVTLREQESFEHVVSLDNNPKSGAGEF